MSYTINSEEDRLEVACYQQNRDWAQHFPNMAFSKCNNAHGWQQTKWPLNPQAILAAPAY